ncbi:B12-binding domain-containing radical SAM protein [Anaerosporobacter faecicola]|uniref:B12-binding domain-containing radical SAM protein n=1 Tax=Anaerosporobacter faecicola TaxID=2718714 RepID=UPI001EE4F9AD|nr:radical SAM protein [Anaerosporobacter faecicola]
MDALFIFFDFSGKFIYHLGQSYIVASLRDKGYRANCFIMDSYATMEEVADAITKLNPKVIGYSIYDYNFYLIKELARLLKERLGDDVVMVAGGPTATFSTQYVIDAIPEIDICSKFAGEEIWPNLLECILHKKDYSHLSSISYRNALGEMIDNPVGNLISDLDHYPSPYLEQVIDIKECQRVNQMVMLVTSRGCVFSCRYCNFAAIGQHSISFNSVDRVIEELRYITNTAKEQGFKPKIEFMDDIFTISRARTVELCQRIIKEQIHIEFGCQTRADLVDEELLELLNKAGCVRISYGLESGVPRILNAMGKVSPTINHTYEKEKVFISKVREAVRLSVALKIDTTVNMIFGWEGETEQEALESLEVLSQMNANHYAHNVLTYYAGTEAFMKVSTRYKKEVEALKLSSPLVLNYNYDNMPMLYNYNPQILPHLPNDLIKYAMSHRRSFIQTIMGIGLIKEQVPQVLLIDKDSINFSKLIKDFGTTIKVHIVEESQPGNITFYYPLRAYGGDCFDGEEFNKLNNAETVEYRKKIAGEAAYTKTFDDKLYVALKDDKDLQMYLFNLEAVDTTKILAQSSYDCSDYMLEDHCRWCDEKECPAIGLKRIIIKGEYIYTCMNGEPIMKWKDFDLVTAQKIVQERFDDACAIRGCNTCEVQEQCPKCMSVTQFGQEKYCEFQHNKYKYKNLKSLYKLKLREYFYTP